MKLKEENYMDYEHLTENLLACDWFIQFFSWHHFIQVWIANFAFTKSDTCDFISDTCDFQQTKLLCN